jgi:glyoxylase-like metal-dependent hydrolase (beta-lactamase superfamily II)
MTSDSMTLHDFTLTTVSGGTLLIDGGNMFGIIPRTMWQKCCPPDQQNRILLDTNCLLIKTPHSIGLIDTGYGDKANEKVRARFQLSAQHTLLQNLDTLGVQPADVNWVILTHLHFDHAGGSTIRKNDGSVQPTFPNAEHFVHRFEYEDAVSGAPELAGAYTCDDFVPLDDAGLLTLVDDRHEVVPGVTTEHTPGHSRGHQSVRIMSGTETAVYLGDLAPMVPHMKTLWSMSYDQFPLIMRQVKHKTLTEIANQHQTAILCHDPTVRFTRLSIDDRGDAVVAPTVSS